MKNIFILIASITITSFSAFAQDQDPKAKIILDDLSKLTKSYKTITSDYIFTIVNKDKKQTEKQTGKVLVKGSKFKLEIPGNTIVCDGKTIWAHNKDANEVTKTAPTTGLIAQEVQEVLPEVVKEREDRIIRRPCSSRLLPALSI